MESSSLASPITGPCCSWCRGWDSCARRWCRSGSSGRPVPTCSPSDDGLRPDGGSGRSVPRPRDGPSGVAVGRLTAPDRPLRAALVAVLVVAGVTMPIGRRLAALAAVPVNELISRGPDGEPLAGSNGDNRDPSSRGDGGVVAFDNIVNVIELQQSASTDGAYVRDRAAASTA